MKVRLKLHVWFVPQFPLRLKQQGHLTAKIAERLITSSDIPGKRQAVQSFVVVLTLWNIVPVNVDILVSIWAGLFVPEPEGMAC